jgi:hypothetical protein
LANVAALSFGLLEELAVVAAHRGREASAMLRVLAARCWRKVRDELWPPAARYLRETSKAQLAAAAHHLRQASRTQLAAIAAVALISAGAGFLTTSTVLHRPAAAETVEVLEPLDAPPPPPKLSWITFYELQNAQKLGRLLLDLSPADLLSMYEREGDAAVENYRDGWVKLDYPITSFDRQTFDRANYDVVEAQAHFNSVFPGKIIAIFNAQKWHARLATHRVGDQIVAFCQFKEIDQEKVMTDIHRLWFYGIRCDLPQR